MWDLALQIGVPVAINGIVVGAVLWQQGKEHSRRLEVLEKKQDDDCKKVADMDTTLHNGRHTRDTVLPQCMEMFMEIKEKLDGIGGKVEILVKNKR